MRFTYTLIALTNILLVSAKDHLTRQYPTLTSRDPANITMAATEAWKKTGGFYYTKKDINLYYTIEGTGAPILLLHGWTCDQSDWVFQVPFLLDHGFQIITLDQRGHGRSSAPEPSFNSPSSTLPYDPVTLASDAAALLSHLGVGNETERGAAIVMGHSLGAVVASELAFRHPNLVKALVLVDPAYYTDTAPFEPIIDMLKNASVDTAPFIVGTLFSRLEASVPQRPAWMGVWRLHRVWGMSGYIVTAVVKQLNGFLTQWTSAAEYRTQRKGVPKLITVAAQSSADLERSVGLAKEDRLEVIDGGHWFFQVNATRFNSIVGEWFTARGYIEG